MQPITPHGAKEAGLDASWVSGLSSAAVLAVTIITQAVAYGRNANRIARSETDVIALSERIGKVEALTGDVKALAASVEHFSERLTASDRLTQTQMKAITDATNGGHALLGAQLGALKELTDAKLNNLTENVSAIRAGFDEMRSFTVNTPNPRQRQTRT